jgi:hypothetical protein
MLRTCAYCDRHDIDGFLSLFVEDGVIDRIGQRHLLSPLVIKVVGPNDANGGSFPSRYDAIAESDGGVLPLKAPVLVGEYDQAYRRNDRERKFALHKVSVVFHPRLGTGV